ncbi:type I restriction-modification enzyme R subunit C-terminal domain-containing protein [Virgibacillus doumboii]|uniref:type I restriction-modification enzyme R subunit C-terminal domain-containing protein n=1 Tax=Virgibacillus doumboii TaxID=2697503 RepID=UPI0013DFC5B7
MCIAKFNKLKPISREERLAKAKTSIFKNLDDKEGEFLDFVLSKYVETGYEELDQEKLPRLLEHKYHSITDAVEVLGGVSKIQETFTSFQKALYQQEAS